MPPVKAVESVVRSFAADFAIHKRTFILSPTQWNQFKLATPLIWQQQPLSDIHTGLIPENRGVYAHSISSRNPNMPPNDYVTYVGLVGDKKQTGLKGADRHLRQRFKEYLKETDSFGRPLVWNILNRYKGFMWFHYAEVTDPVVSLHQIETALLDALLPPCNKEDFSINIRQAQDIVYGG